MAAREGRQREADELDRGALRPRRTAFASVAIALAAYLPETRRRSSSALGQPERPRLGAVAYGRTAAADGIVPAAAALPADRRSRTAVARDRHPRAPRRAARSRRTRCSPRAREAGVERVITIGTGIDSCRAALAIAEASSGVFARARHPSAPGGRTGGARRLSTSCASCSGTSARSPWARPGSTTTATTRRTTRSGALFEAQLELAARASACRSSSTPARPRRRHAAALAASTARVVLHCFSSPALLDVGARARLLRLVRRQRHVPEAPTSCATRPRRPRRPDPRRDRQPVPGAAAAARASRTSRRTSSTRSRRSPTPAARTRHELAARIDVNADRRLRLPVASAP